MTFSCFLSIKLYREWEAPFFYTYICSKKGFKKYSGFKSIFLRFSIGYFRTTIYRFSSVWKKILKYFLNMIFWKISCEIRIWSIYFSEIVTKNYSFLEEWNTWELKKITSVSPGFQWQTLQKNPTTTLN